MALPVRACTAGSILLALAASVVLAMPASAQSSLAGSPGQAQSSPVAALEGGAEIADIRVAITGSTGDPLRDNRIRQEATGRRRPARRTRGGAARAALRH